MSLTWASHGPAEPAPVASSASDAKQQQRKPAASRQLLSCTKCRERKVKCDRTKPCTACCARGHPKECEFIVGEGNDYAPIPQSYEIKKLRQENQRLREKLLAARLPQSGDEDDDDGFSKRPPRPAGRSHGGRQRRFKTHDRIDNLYFGTPGLATVIHEFANLRITGGAQSLTHPMPRGSDIYAPEASMYPFSVIVNYSNPTQLWELLPEREELFACLDLFQDKARSCSFPHMPDEVTKREVERFLQDKEHAVAFPDMLALIFATVATGLQMGQYERNGNQWSADAVETTRRRGDAFISASMQALREASFMSRPTLLGLQALIMMGPYLTNSGRFLDAWTLFGTTIRIAHSIGLHRHPALLDPTPSLHESRVRQTLWWWMLHMDQQYSITLGRPLGISGIGDCPPPEISTTDTTMMRLHKFMDDFTVLSRQILCSSDMTSVHRIDEYTEKLIKLWDTMPEALQFNESWLQESAQLPDAPLDTISASLFAKIHSLLIVINRQRLEHTPVDLSPEAQAYDFQETPIRRAPVRGHSLVIDSALSVLRAFLYFYHRNQALLVCWTMGQQAFNAAMILLLDAWEAEYEQDMLFVHQTYAVFVELEKNGVHKLAKLASQRIYAAMEQVQRRNEQRNLGGRRGSDFTQQDTKYEPDSAPLTDLGIDTVMGGAGMYVLEDQGLQFNNSSFGGFRYWGFPSTAESSAHPSNPSGPPTPTVLPPSIPVSQIAAAPFPVMATAPMTPYDLGLQTRIAPARQSTAPGPAYTWHSSIEDPMVQQSSFNAINSAGPIHTQYQPHQSIAYSYPPQPQRASSSRQQSFLARDPQAPQPAQRYSQQQHRHSSVHGQSNGGGGAGGGSRARSHRRPQRATPLPRSQRSH